MADGSLTFIIPVRHPENCKNWPELTARLAQTAWSISGQLGSKWSGIVVANRGCDLPGLPGGFLVIYVDYEPNRLYDIASAERERVYDAVRFDKGRRILAGLVGYKPRGHVMVVDDDDFVSNRLATFVQNNPEHNGWYFNHGYVWSEGGGLIYKHDKFSQLCGTSHIVRWDLLQFPATVADASPDYVKSMLGSHIYIDEYLRAQGTPLDILPFPGAIYRTGHAGSHSQSSGLVETFLLPAAKRSPLHFLKSISKVRRLSAEIREEFMLLDGAGVEISAKVKREFFGA